MTTTTITTELVDSKLHRLCIYLFTLMESIFFMFVWSILWRNPNIYYGGSVPWPLLILFLGPLTTLIVNIFLYTIYYQLKSRFH